MSAPSPGESEQCVEAKGPWPFITYRVFAVVDKPKRIWHSRPHRKGLLQRAARETEVSVAKLTSCLWAPRTLNWWIGTIFALGSSLFALASVFSLTPSLAEAWSLDTSAINAVFFAGSIPFTIAAYLQLFQAANVGKPPGDDSRPRSRPALIGWRPGDVGWLSCALQFVGTILFNFSTRDAMLPSLTWLQEDLVIWAPNIIGSILFLASGYLAFIETCHTHWSWKPRSVSWWVVFTNLLGCVGFMISAMFAIVLPGAPNVEAMTISVVFTLLGAMGFLIGSLLMLPEAVSSDEAASTASLRRRRP